MLGGADSVLGVGGRRWLLVLFVIAAALRVGWVAVRFSSERGAALQYPDEEAYRLTARSIAAGAGLADEFGFRATYMPAYPAFLASFEWLSCPLFWARIVQALLGAWVAPATFLLAREWARLAPAGLNGQVSGAWMAILPGLAVAFDPFLIFFSGLLLTETLFAAALVTAWTLVLPIGQAGDRGGVRQACAAGAMLWVCVMLRASAVILVILVPVAVTVWRRFDRGGVAAGAVIAGVVIAGLIPWAARNRVATGEWRWLTTRGGISLYDGLREGATGASDLAHTKRLAAVAGMSEVEWDCYFRSQAWAAARRDPVRMIRLGWRKFLRTWSLTPNVEPYRRGPAAVISAAWMLVVLVSAAVGWFEHRGAVRWWAMLLLPVLAFTLLHTIFVGSVRYRLPVMPMVMVLSAAGVAAMFGRLAATRREARRRSQK